MRTMPSVGRNLVAREVAQRVGVLKLGGFLRPVHRAALGLHATGQLDERLGFSFGKLGIQHLGAVLAVIGQVGLAVA
ncbi:hypothetical protein LP416_24370 [Polaromonas sp. P2-4]|nr:hypothetical protein LP416_24370 [Polaromonas sp. P2-4]